MVKTAVVGLGKMGLSHLAIANALDDIEVVAICDTSSLVGGVIEKYGFLRYLSEYNNVLEVDGLEAVIIATPTTAHESMVEAAFERGLHVFCEKPLTVTSAASARLTEMAKRKGLVAQAGYHNRFVATFAEVRRLLVAGALGKVSHVLAEAYGPVVLKPAKDTWRTQAGGGGGCLNDYAAHPINLLNWYLGRATSVSGALLKSGFSSHVDDEVYATLGFENAVTGQLSVNWSDPSVRKMTTRISVWGERGKIFADRQEIQVFLTNENAALPGYSRGWNVKYITDLTPPVSFYLRGEEYSAQLEAFGRAAKAGIKAEENDFEGAADTDATIEMIRASAGASSGLVGSRESGLSRRGRALSRIFGR